jgi:HAE1 family hydrophobic/amphiphilic exporter-1
LLIRIASGAALPARYVIAVLALLWALAPSPMEAAPGQGRALTLEEAIAMALEKNEGILIERAALGSAAAAAEGAQGAYDPLLGLEAGWRQTTEPVNSAFSGAPDGELAPTFEGSQVSAGVRQLFVNGSEISVRALSSRDESDASFDLLSPSYGSQLGFEFRQPLLRDRTIDGARLGLKVTAADHERATASLRREVSETVAAVERAYWALSAARREIGVREEAVRLADEQLAETNIRIQNGAAPETEIAQPRAELERRRGELLAAQETVARAENTLKLLILDDTDTAPWLEPLAPVEDAAVEPIEVDTAAAIARALEARPELEAAQAFVARRRAETLFARDGIRPALDLVVSYDRFGLAGSRNPRGAGIPGLPVDVPPELEGNLPDSFSRLVDGDFDDTRVGLVFEVPLGNRAARASAAIAKNTERQAEAELTRARKLVRAEVLDAAAALETANGRIEAARAAREAAEVQLGAERERFAVGLSTNFLVLTRQNDLSSARLDEIAALTDHRTARTELARATGTLLEERGIQVEAR